MHAGEGCPPVPSNSSQIQPVSHMPLKKIWSEKSENRASSPSFPPIENSVCCITIYSRWYMGLIGQGGMGTVKVRPWSCVHMGPEPASPHLPWLPAEVPGAAQGSSQTCARKAEGIRAHRADGSQVLSRKVQGHPGVLPKTAAPSTVWGQHHRPCCHPTSGHSYSLLRVAGTSHGLCG